MAADSELGLLFKIAADPSQAQDAIAKMKESVAGLVEQTKASSTQELESLGFVRNAWEKNAAAARAAQEAAQQSGVAQTAAFEEIAAASQAAAASEGEEVAALETGNAAASEYAANYAALKEASQAAARGTSLWHTMNQGVIGDLRLMRYAMYAFTTPMMFSYIVPQVIAIASAVRDATSAMEGLDAKAKKAFADIVKGADEALTKFQGLTIAQKIWQGQQLEAQTQQRINFDIATRQAIESQSYWHNLAEEMRPVLDLLTGGGTAAASADASIFVSQFKMKATAVADELEQEKLLSQQHQALAALEKQLHQQTKKGTDALHAHADALAALILQERNEVEQLSIGDSARRQAVASYDAEIRRIDAVTAALKRQKEFTGAEAKKAQEARTLAAEIRDQKLKQIDDKEAARHRALLAGWERDTEHTLDRLGRSIQAHRHKQIAEAAHGAAQAGLHPLLGVHGVPSLAGHMTLQNQATLAATAHIDAETRAVWNLKDAFMGLAPVMDQFTREHPALAKSVDEFSHGMGAAAAQAIVYGDNVATAMRKAAQAEIESLAARAIVHALYETAVGFAELFWHPAAAAAAFQSAAIFGLVGGAAAAAGAALGGGGGQGSRASRFTGSGGSGAQSAEAAPGGSAPSSALAPGARGASAPSGSLTIAIMGDEHAGTWLANTLNRAVTEQGVRLVSSHTQRAAPVGQ